MDATSVLKQVREFVSAFSAIPDLQFSAVPYSLESHEGIAYLLLVASIDQSTAAESVRDLVKALYNELGDDLLTIHKVPPSQYELVLEKFRAHAPGWRIRKKIPSILCSASRFIEEAEKDGGLVEWGRRQPSVGAAAEKIATGIFHMGKDRQGARKKTWMFMRWMVRSEPDIGVWNPPLSPVDLCVPLDRNTGKAFSDLVQVSPFKDLVMEKGIRFKWKIPKKIMESNRKNVECVTEVARWIFPDDPAQVDYAFFCYGRRFSIGEDGHRCWKIVDCNQCSIRKIIDCPSAVGMKREGKYAGKIRDK